MKTKLFHVVSSLDSPAITRIIAMHASEKSPPNSTICSVESARPRRRRRTVAEVMTVMDGVDGTSPHELDQELRRLDQDIVDNRRQVLARLKETKIGVVSAERRHRFDFTTAMRIRRLLRMSKPDAVQTWDDSARRWVDIAAGNLGVPIQCSASSLEPGALVDGRLRLDGSHALSRSQFLAELRLPIGSKLIGTIGPLVARRRIKDLIWAIELLRIVDDDTYLIIAGEGPEEWRLHRFRDQVGIRHRVRFLGSRLGCEDCLEHLDFYWAASKRYDDPRFVKAAMSAGVPVVATDIPGHQELITSDVDGFLVKPGDRAAFARHTWRMLNDASIVDRIGTAGRRRRDKSMVE